MIKIKPLCLIARRSATAPALTPRLLLTGTFICAVLSFGLTMPLAAQSAPTGTITGRVSNLGTEAYLEGARLTLQPSGQSALSGRDGRFNFPQVPPGVYELTVGYTGLEPQVLSVSVEAGRTTSRDVALSSEIYSLSEYVVPGEREGSALALTLQRNAPNVKNILSSDAFGNVADENIGNFLMRIPGISVESQEGQAFRIQVRGVSADYNAVTIDGTRAANGGPRSGMNRAFEIDKIPADFVDTIEVTKAPTPDMDADSIGGAINLKTKSAFNRKGRLVTYTLGGSYNVDRDTYRPAASFMYSDLLGPDQRLGVMLTASFNRAHKPRDHNRQEWERTTDTDRPVWSYLQVFGEDQLKHTRAGLGLRLDYKLDDNTSIFFNGMHSEYKDGLNRKWVQFFGIDFRVVGRIDANGIPRVAVGNQTATILPGWTDTVTETINHVFRYNQVHRDRRIGTSNFQVGGERTFANGKLDLSASFSPSKGTDKRFTPIREVSGAGFRFDRGIKHRWATASFEQISGPDVYDPANSRINNIIVNDDIQHDRIWGAQGNYRRNFDLAAPSYIKTGFRLRGQERWQELDRTYHTYVGPDGVMGPNPATGINDDNLARFIDHGYNYRSMGGFNPVVPFTDLEAVRSELKASPHLFTDDVVRRLRESFRNDIRAEEKVYAGYLMGGTQIGPVGILTGLRVEHTDVKGLGSIQVVTPEEQARRAAWTGPVTVAEQLRRTEAEFGNYRTRTGKYRNVFPGVHFRYEVFDGLLARASYSSGIGRPNFTTIIPNDSVNHTTQTVVANNTSLRPQYSDNFDLSLEYYFEPAGMLSAGVFLKEIKDFIYTADGGMIAGGLDNGFSGEYEGYLLRTQHNGGFARVRGAEVAYQQQFSHLPGFWRGFGIFANHTWLESVGNYGTPGAVLTQGELANFVPRTGNIGVSYIDHGWTVRVQMNYTGVHLSSFQADPSRRLYAYAKKPVDLNIKYDINRRMSVFLDVINVFDYPMERFYWYIPERERGSQKFTPMAKFGFNGRL